jgi:glutamyl-tRNA synthetase
VRGRFAPSPTGELHLGNLRTALLAWLFARSVGSGFLLRFEDLDTATVRHEFYDTQRRSLERLGLDWDDELRQTDHLDRYHDVIERLRDVDAIYECYCTRREIREAATAPHGNLLAGAYPGTCRRLSEADRRTRRECGRPPALRLRGPSAPVEVIDRLGGPHRGVVDDIVVMRGDGVPAYNLVVVIDDAYSSVGEVVRGDDLLDSTPRQIHVAAVLGLRPPSYAHVPLVLGPDGARLAKRNGAVGLDDRIALGETPSEVRAMLARSAGLADATPADTAADLAARFDPGLLSSTPWRIDPGAISARSGAAGPS